MASSAAIETAMGKSKRIPAVPARTRSSIPTPTSGSSAALGGEPCCGRGRKGSSTGFWSPSLGPTTRSCSSGPGRATTPLHAGIIWASEHGLALSRFAPMPPTV
jgi:hypothetical protein